MQVVREIEHRGSGVRVITEDDCIYEANYVLVSVSIGVLQSNLVAFHPPLPVCFVYTLFSFVLYITVLYFLLSSSTGTGARTFVFDSIFIF